MKLSHSAILNCAYRIFGFGCIFVGVCMSIYALLAMFGMSDEYSVAEGWSLALITSSLILLGVIMVRGLLSKGNFK